MAIHLSAEVGLAPPPAEWLKPDFDDSAWTQGASGFGSRFGREDHVHTHWNTTDLWARTTITVPAQGAQWPLLDIYYGVDP